MPSLREHFGDIDIYLFDQLLRGRIAPGMKIFDAGCGGGRNLIYFFKEGYDVYGVDGDASAVAEVRRIAASLAPSLAPANFRAETIEGNSFPTSFADVVLSSAVLHFARDESHFRAMLFGSWRVLKPGGLFFCRLASSIGLERQIIAVSGRRLLLPDGSERYLVDEQLLDRFTGELEAQLLDPVKSTVVQNQRSMTTWVLQKLRRD